MRPRNIGHGVRSWSSQDESNEPSDPNESLLFANIWQMAERSEHDDLGDTDVHTVAMGWDVSILLLLDLDHLNWVDARSL